MTNWTEKSNLVQRLNSVDIDAVSINEPASVKGFAIIVSRAAGQTSESSALDVFTVKSRKERTQWWKFWEHNKNETSYIYYLVDLRDRYVEFDLHEPVLRNSYTLDIGLRIDFTVEDPRRVALGIDDALGKVVDHVQDATHKFTLTLDDFVGLNDVELMLQKHLETSEVKFFERLGIRIFDIRVQVTLPQQYLNDLDLYIAEQQEKDDERRKREQNLSEQEELSDYEIRLEEIRTNKERELTELQIDYEAQLEQLKRIQTETKIKEKRRETQAQIQIVKYEEELQQLQDQLEGIQQERKLLNERKIRLIAQKTNELSDLQSTLGQNAVLKAKAEGALEILGMMGLTSERYPWIVQAVTAYVINDPSKGFMRLHEMASNILSENRNSAKEALKQFYEVTRPAIEAGYLSPKELKEVVQTLIPALSGADMNNYIQGENLLDEADQQQKLDYDGPALDDYDDFSELTNNYEDYPDLEDNIADVEMPYQSQDDLDVDEGENINVAINNDNNRHDLPDDDLSDDDLSDDDLSDDNENQNAEITFNDDELHEEKVRLSVKDTNEVDGVASDDDLPDDILSEEEDKNIQ